MTDDIQPDNIDDIEPDNIRKAAAAIINMPTKEWERWKEYKNRYDFVEELPSGNIVYIYHDNFYKSIVSPNKIILVSENLPQNYKHELTEEAVRKHNNLICRALSCFMSRLKLLNLCMEAITEPYHRIKIPRIYFPAGLHEFPGGDEVRHLCHIFGFFSVDYGDLSMERVIKIWQNQRLARKFGFYGPYRCYSLHDLM